MLTLDDLDHFSGPNMAHLFAPSTRHADADTLARLSRLVACLNFCRDIADDELVDGGLHAARSTLKGLLRQQQRNRRLAPDELMGSLEGALLALGVQAQRHGEPSHAAPERHAVEAEIQTAASRATGEDTLDPQFMDALARGQFEILPSSNIAALTRTIGKSAGTVAIDVDFAVDGAGPASLVRVHLVVESGFWRWTAGDGCCMSRNGHPAVFLPPDDGVVQALLAGLALRSGRTIAAWAEATCEHDDN